MSGVNSSKCLKLVFSTSLVLGFLVLPNPANATINALPYCTGSESNCKVSFEYSNDGQTWVNAKDDYALYVSEPHGLSIGMNLETAMNVDVNIKRIDRTNPSNPYETALVETDVNKTFRAEVRIDNFNPPVTVGALTNPRLQRSGNSFKFSGNPMFMTSNPVGVTDPQVCAALPESSSVSSNDYYTFNFSFMQNTNPTMFQEPLFITSNGSCTMSSPMLDMGTLKYSVSSMHFLRDGQTLNYGHYEAVLSAEFLAARWNTSAADLMDRGFLATSTKNGISSDISYFAEIIDDTSLHLRVTGFTFSSPTIGLTPKSRQSLQTNLPSVAKRYKSFTLKPTTKTGQQISASVAGQCKIKANYTTKRTKVGKKWVKTKVLKSYTLTMGKKKGATCTVRQTSAASGSLAALNSVNTITLK